MPLANYANFPLFISAQSEVPTSGAFTLFTRTGSTPTASGLYRTLPFYLDSVSGNVVTAPFPLYVSAGNRGSGSAISPLFVQGDYHRAEGAISLFVQNGVSGLSQGVDLFIAGLGGQEGALPFSGSFPLFMQRGEARALPLFIQGPGLPLSGGVSLFVQGANTVSSGLSLALSRVSVRQSGDVPLRVAGW